MRKLALAGTLLGLSFLMAGCGNSERKHEIHLSQSEEWSVFENLMAETQGWDKQSAHELRLSVQSKGDTPQHAQGCWESRLQPGEWSASCRAYAEFEARNGIAKKTKGEIGREMAKLDEEEQDCGPAYFAEPHLAAGPKGSRIPSVKIGCADVGEKRWPLTVPGGLLQCEPLVISGLPVERVTFEAPDGTIYAVNGHALDAGYPEIDPIWKDDPTGIAPKVNIGPLIDKGLNLCQRPG
jgi:hypothetical protein